jgi:formamidopyrimidine-DNA glycosylase
MPELPEVETIRRNLSQGSSCNPALIGKVLTGSQILWGRTLSQPSKNEFQKRIPGQNIEDIGRRGKYLLFYLSKDCLVFHLRMSGDIVIEPVENPVAPHHRLLINLEGGLRMAFNDTRKFGRVWLLPDPGELLSSLGPEPLDPAFTPEIFYQRLRSRSRQLKPLLMDQTFLAGLGNIYTDEALHRARLHPLVISDTLTGKDSAILLDSIRHVLSEGINRNGASIDWVYKGGDFQNYFCVYQRTGEACPVCGTIIERMIVAQRSTHICPCCQPTPVNSKRNV